LNSVYIGIDLAWGEKNLSGFCTFEIKSNQLNIIELKLLKSIDNIVQEILKYKDTKIFVGIDAPIVIPNEANNRNIEKEFNKDFSIYKLSMLPVNRNILTKYSSNIRGEELYKKLSFLGFKKDYKADKVIFEVYPHSTIAMCFNNHNILQYKRKKGRDISFIREQLMIYQNYLKKEFISHDIFKENILKFKGQSLKDLEDKLDAITCAYSIWYCRFNEVKFYQIDGINTFVTPISKWKLYILKCNDNTLYTGITTNLERRLKEHNHLKSGAKYTHNRRPVKLIYYENCNDRIDASRREYEIKKLSRKDKLQLID